MTIETSGYAVSGNGSNQNGTNITINGGTLKSTKSLGIYHPQDGDLTINGGSISGITGVEIRSGTLIMNGGSVEGTASGFVAVENGNGPTSEGAGIAVVQHTTEMSIDVSVKNGDISGIKALYEANVQENEDGSHTLVLVTAAGVQSEIIIRNGTDGESGHSPQISVREVDGVMYWTIDGEFVLDTEGQRIPVTGEDGATPEFKIENGIWYVSYDGWATSLECGPAQTEADPSVFKDASLSEDGKYAYLTLVDGTVLTFEIYRQFGIVFDSAEKYVSSGSEVSVPFTITGADENTVMETICSSGWTAEVTMNEDWTGTLDIAAPAESSTGKVIVLVNDGGYKTLMRTLTFISGTLNISTSSVQVPASGGPVTVEVETDMEYEVSIPEDAQSWISVVETRSEMRTETLSLSVGTNETGLPRQAEIELVSGDAVIETVLVYQLVDYDKDIMVLTVQARELTGTAASYSRKVYIPLYGAVNVHVDWGDGSSEDVDKTVTSAATMVQHEYAVEGQYCVTVKGTAAQMKGTAVNKNAAPAITGVIQWGMLGLTSLEDAFRYNTSITAVPMPEDGAFAGVTTVEGMFEG